jgi:hypothetical protein
LQSRTRFEPSSLLSNRKLSTTAATRRGLQMMLVGPARSALPEADVAARPSSNKRTGLLVAATRMMMMI